MAPPKKAPALRYKIPAKARQTVLTEPVIGGIAKKANTISQAYNYVSPLLFADSRRQMLKDLTGMKRGGVVKPRRRGRR